MRGFFPPGGLLFRLVERYARRIIQLGTRSHSTVAGKTSSTIARERLDRSGTADNANPVIVVIRDIDIAGTVHRDAGRIIQCGAGGRATISAVAGQAVASDSRQSWRRRVLPDALVAGVRDVEIVGNVERHAGGAVKPDAGGNSAVAAIPENAAARNGVDSTGNNFADTLVVGVRDIDIVGTIERDAGRIIKLGADGWASPKLPTVPSPATVLIVPVAAFTMRMRLFC
jgi:hypothetical protein